MRRPSPTPANGSRFGKNVPASSKPGCSRAKSSMMPTAVSGFTSPSASTASCSFVESSKVSTTGLFRQVELARHEVDRADRPVALAPQPFELCAELCRGQVVITASVLPDLVIHQHRTSPSSFARTAAAFPSVPEQDHRLGIRALRRYRIESRRLGRASVVYVTSGSQSSHSRIPASAVASICARTSSRPVRDTEREVLEPRDDARSSPTRCRWKSRSDLRTIAYGSAFGFETRYSPGPSGMGRASARCSRRSAPSTGSAVQPPPAVSRQRRTRSHRETSRGFQRARRASPRNVAIDCSGLPRRFGNRMLSIGPSGLRT